MPKSSLHCISLVGTTAKLVDSAVLLLAILLTVGLIGGGCACPVTCFGTPTTNPKATTKTSDHDINNIPLRDTQPALGVNWCELTLIRQSDGKVLYQGYAILPK